MQKLEGIANVRISSSGETKWDHEYSRWEQSGETLEDQRDVTKVATDTFVAMRQELKVFSAYKLIFFLILKQVHMSNIPTKDIP